MESLKGSRVLSWKLLKPCYFLPLFLKNFGYLSISYKWHISLGVSLSACSNYFEAHIFRSTCFVLLSKVDYDKLFRRFVFSIFLAYRIGQK